MEIQSSTGVKMVLYKDPLTGQSSVRKMENGRGMEEKSHANVNIILYLLQD